MGRMIVLYDNLADTGIVTGPASATPLTNMQSDRLERVWRSSDPTNLNNTKFNVSLPAVETLRAIVLARTNLTTANRVRFQAYSDSARTTEVYDSDWIQSAVRADWGTLPWRDRNWYKGFQPHDDPERPPDIVHILPGSGVTRQYWTISIDDQENPDGYVEVSRLMMAKAFAPSLSNAFGASLFFEDNTLRQTTLSGSEVTRRRVNPRVQQFAIDYLPDSEAFGAFYDFWRRSGFDREVYWIPDVDIDGDELQRRSFLGTITQADSIRQAMVGRSSVGCVIKERI